MDLSPLGVEQHYLDLVTPRHSQNALDLERRLSVDDEGGLVDVCTGTGVQTSTRDYLDRGAIFGLDDRGGSMAIWFATELERYLREPTPKM